MAYFGWVRVTKRRQPPGTSALDRLLAGVVDLPQLMASPTGSAKWWNVVFKGIEA